MPTDAQPIMIERWYLGNDKLDEVMTLDAALDQLCPKHYSRRDVAEERLRDGFTLRSAGYEYLRHDPKPTPPAPHVELVSGPKTHHALILSSQAARALLERLRGSHCEPVELVHVSDIMGKLTDALEPEPCAECGLIAAHDKRCGSNSPYPQGWQFAETSI